MQLSIITINLNNAEGLNNTIESIAGQTFTGFEYIVIDGNSTDGSVAVIEKHIACVDYWVSEKDAGVYDAMNKGITKARGKYLMFLNSGDILAEKNILEIGNEYMQNSPETSIFYGDTYFKSKGKAQYLHRHPVNVNVDFLRIRQLNHQSSFISASLFTDYGLYPLDYKFAADHWLYLKSIVGGKEFIHINCAMVIYDHDGLSIANMAQYRIEADKLWKEIVPDYVKKLVDELEVYRRVYGFKLVKVAHALSERIEKQRKRK